MLRIEDTDLERSTRRTWPRFSMPCAGWSSTADEGPVSQVGRAEDHAAALRSCSIQVPRYPDAATADDVKAWKSEHGRTGGTGEPPSEDGSGTRYGCVAMTVTPSSMT